LLIDERITTMKVVTGVLMIFVCMAPLPATAQQGTRFGIVSGEETVPMKITRDVRSVRGLRILRFGAICKLLPGDKVWFSREDSKIVHVVRIHNTRRTKIGWQMLKSIVSVGRSDVCPMRAQGIVPNTYRKPWVDLYLASEPVTSQ
jgi:hypothetical protein